MMKNKAHAPIKGLLFRELYMGRNTYISITAIFFGIMLLCVLVLLSLDFGNLSKLPADVIDSARSTIRSVSIYVPAAIFFMNTSVVVDTAAHDYSEKWQRFMYSSPVSEAKFMGIKFGFMLATAVVGFVLSALSGLMMGALMGEPLNYTDLAVISAIMLVIVLFAAAITVLSFLLRSTTLAIVIILVCGYIGMMVFVFANEEKLDAATDDESIGVLLEGAFDIAEGIFPFVPLLLIAVIALGWWLSTLALKKRDRKPPQAKPEKQGLFSKKTAESKEV